MLHTPHFLVGAAIATQIPDPAVATLAALTSHFVMDTIPHVDYIGAPKITPANLAVAAGDGVVALILFFAVIEPTMWGYAFFIGLMANLPDFVEFPGFVWPKWRTLPLLKQFSHWHGQVLQYQRELTLPKTSWQYWFWGLLPQVLLIIFLTYFLVMK